MRMSFESVEIIADSLVALGLVFRSQATTAATELFKRSQMRNNRLGDKYRICPSHFSDVTTAKTYRKGRTRIPDLQYVFSADGNSASYSRDWVQEFPSGAGAAPSNASGPPAASPAGRAVMQDTVLPEANTTTAPAASTRNDAAPAAEAGDDDEEEEEEEEESEGAVDATTPRATAGT
jgi:hypothetical protein